MNNNFILLLFTLSTLLGCKDNSNTEESFVYVGGEIVNPNNNYVILTSPDEKVDTLYLDENNRFLKKLTLSKAGLYTFIHGGEYQRILLEPKDSLLLRLNTMDFDESLVFTGEGAKKNNYLISVFLENQVDNKKFMKMMWDMEPTKFETILNQNRDKKLSDLSTFISQKNYSELFKTIAESNINYNYYYNKELYPFGYFGYNNLIHYKDLPENFYDFRSKVDYNNENLSGVIPYYKFLFYHFNNLALGKYYENATHNVVFDKKSAIYNLEKLRLMDSLIENETIRNHLLKYTTRDFVSSSNDSTEIDEVFKSFYTRSSSDADKIFIQDLVSSVNRLRSGNTIPNVKLINFDEDQVEIVNLISKPTLIYFWSSNLPVLQKNSHFKMKSLKSRYPEMDFIAVNINDVDRTHWKDNVNRFKFPISNEYQFENPKEAMRQLAINSVNRSILVDENGKIISSNAMLFTTEFEDELEHLLKKEKAHQK